MGGIANRSWVGIDLGAADELVSVESGELLSLLRSEGGAGARRARVGDRQDRRGIRQGGTL